MQVMKTKTEDKAVYFNSPHLASHIQLLEAGNSFALKLGHRG